MKNFEKSSELLRTKEDGSSSNGNLNTDYYSIYKCYKDKGVYDDYQLKVIDFGLKSGLDVSAFAKLNKNGKPVFSGNQMESISLCQLEGLDVTIMTTLDDNEVPVLGEAEMERLSHFIEKRDFPEESVKNDAVAEGSSVSDSAQVDSSLCIGCAACVGVCPVSAVSISAEGFAAVDENTCVSCGTCTSVCPTGAIHLSMNPPLYTHSGEEVGA